MSKLLYSIEDIGRDDAFYSKKHEFMGTIVELKGCEEVDNLFSSCMVKVIKAHPKSDLEEGEILCFNEVKLKERKDLYDSSM